MTRFRCSSNLGASRGLVAGTIPTRRPRAPSRWLGFTFTVVPTHLSASDFPRKRSAFQRPLMLCGSLDLTPLFRNSLAARVDVLLQKHGTTSRPVQQDGSRRQQLLGSLNQLLRPRLLRAKENRLGFIALD